jgi:hypothetical protein
MKEICKPNAAVVPNMCSVKEARFSFDFYIGKTREALGSIPSTTKTKQTNKNFMCKVEGYESHSHFCATITTIHLENFFIFPNRNCTY